MSQSPNPTLIKSASAMVALLLPLMAVAESQFHAAAPTTAVQATAHLNFKIVIPQVLFLKVAPKDVDRAQSVSVMSTGRNVTMTAAAGSIILTAAARRSIAQDVPCARADPHLEAQQRGSLTTNTGTMVCTASMP